jgi:mgtE-like transporter
MAKKQEFYDFRKLPRNILNRLGGGSTKLLYDFSKLPGGVFEFLDESSTKVLYDFGKMPEGIFRFLGESSSRIKGELEFNFFTIIKEAFPLTAVFAFAGLAAGAVFSRIAERIMLIPGLLVLVPAIMNLRGVIGSSLGARLGSAYHMGLIEPEVGLNDEIIENFKASAALTGISSIFSAFVAFIFCIFLGLPHVTLLEFLIVSLGTGILASAVMLSFTYFIAITSARMGFDPDNVTIPAVTTIGDIVTLSVTLVMVYMVVG